jgi:predicted metal-dependent HD superfamily phosphohydrolase
MEGILANSIEHVKGIYATNEDPTLQYHTWEHTEIVLNSVAEMADAIAEIIPEEKEALQLAAVFHDVAHISGSENHEADGAQMAENYLSHHDCPESQIQLIRRMILATKMGHEPTDLLEQIIQDADMSHLRDGDYMDTAFKRLYTEFKARFKHEMTMKEWAVDCIGFFERHEYHTNFALENFSEGKAENLKKIVLMSETEDVQDQQSQEELVKKPKNKSKKKAKSDLPEKGIETMFRVSLRNHLNLSRIADNKANTLISVNAIIISIVLTTLLPKMDNNPYLIYPGLTLMGFSVITIVIAILSTIPKTTHGKMTRDEVEGKKGNLLFFGNFHKMTLEDYEWSMEELMQDKDYLYKSLIRDLYFLGKVLNKKYALLRYSYYIFVAGLVLSIVLFVINLQTFTI